MSTRSDHSEFIPFSRPDIGPDEIDRVVKVLRSDWLTSGPETAAFEQAFREYTGAPHALAVNSCTSGLHLALAGLRIGPGDEVITTPLTFCATVNVIIEVGAKPVLADVGHDLNIDVDRVRALITDRTRAIVPVHLAGLPCDLDPLRQLAAEHSIAIVEDAAHAAGTRYKDEMIGSGKSAAVAFSFYATKNLSTGEGGMLTTGSEELYNRMKCLCLHGINRDAWGRYTQKGSWYYEVSECGFKYNMSDIVAALGIEQLQRLDAMNARRAEIAATYNRAFANMPEVEPPPDRADSVHAWHLYVLRLNLDTLSIDRAQFFEEMHARCIGCSVHFIPIPLHPYYRRTLELRDPCTRAMTEYPRLLSLPLYSKMTDGDVGRVIDAIRDVVYRFKTQTAVHCSVELPAY